MSGLIEGRLGDLKIDLPPAPAPVGAYLPVIQIGNLIVTSGQLPWMGKQLAFTGPVGGRVTVQDGYEAARLCSINALAQNRLCTTSTESGRLCGSRGTCSARRDFATSPKCSMAPRTSWSRCSATAASIPARRWESAKCRSMRRCSWSCGRRLKSDRFLGELRRIGMASCAVKAELAGATARLSNRAVSLLGKPAAAPSALGNRVCERVAGGIRADLAMSS